jgi:hypothetical protein
MEKNINVVCIDAPLRNSLVLESYKVFGCLDAIKLVV